MEQLAAWQTHTRSTVVMRTMPGKHFFVVTHRDVLIRLLTNDLVNIARTGPPLSEDVSSETHVHRQGEVVKEKDHPAG
jgi:hypothetical protein